MKLGEGPEGRCRHDTVGRLHYLLASPLHLSQSLPSAQSIHNLHHDLKRRYPHTYISRELYYHAMFIHRRWSTTVQRNLEVPLVGEARRLVGEYESVNGVLNMTPKQVAAKMMQ